MNGTRPDASDRSEPILRRDPEGAASERYDLVVVGGGVQGAAAALEGVARGLRTILLERDDFGGETTAASLRILHGGLRYLQRGDLSRFRDSVSRRRWWMARFPTLVRPLPCVLPLSGEGRFRPSVLRAALLTNDLLSGDRNRGVPEGVRLPPSRVLSAREVRERFPLVGEDAARAGGALWHDASMERSQRLVMELLRWAVTGGAVALNRVEATGLLVEGGRVAGVRGVDRRTGESHLFRAPCVLNAAGPWVDGWAGAQGAATRGSLFRPSVAWNLLVDRPLGGEGALGVRGRTGTVYFLRSWGPFTVVGTGHGAWSGTVPGPPAGEAAGDLAGRLLEEVSDALPAFGAGPGEVLRVLWGFLPAEVAGTDRLARRPEIRLHGGARGGVPGMVSVAPVKFTTAPAVAERALDALGIRRGREREAFLSAPPAPRSYPSPEGWRAMQEEDPEGARRLLRRIAREESAEGAEDLVLRRLDWGLELRDVEDWIDRIRGILSGDAGASASDADRGDDRGEEGA